MLFLAYELGYWFNHWLSHKVPVLWEFHKVHHTAEVLTPLTNFRVHPIYALDLRQHSRRSRPRSPTASAITCSARPPINTRSADTNIILVLFIHAYVHLQHSHMWISFRGVLGRIFVSPAHHQVHHSGNPKHFNKNFGSCLALWDWMFGTLYVPAQEARAAGVRLSGPRRCAHRQGRVGGAVRQRRRPSQAALPQQAPAIPVADASRPS